MEKAIKFSIENKQFVRALKTATKVINRKNALPILSSVKLTMQDGRLTMTSGNSEAFITQPLADFALLDGPKEWAVCCDPDGKAPLHRLRDQQGVFRHRTAAHRRHPAKPDAILNS